MQLRFFDTFTGIGGFTKGIFNVFPEAECVGHSEINKYASSIYNYHYPNHKNYGDITKIDVSKLPDFDLFVGGFPCQAFSIAGKRQGFKDTRGTLFFDVARILKAKQPEWFLLENVKGLLSHERGKTLGTIYKVLTELGYTVGWEVVNSCHFGVPQSRERIFIIGHLREAGGRTGEILPIGKSESLLAKINGQRQGGEDIASTLTKNYHRGVHGAGETYIKSGTWRTHKDGRGFREVESGLAPTIPARAREDGSGQPVIKNGDTIRRLTPLECERLQGFKDGWTAKGIMDGEEVDISDTQRYKTLGNAVTTNVIEAIMRKIKEQL